jgi:uncharacterized sulfatase
MIRGTFLFLMLGATAFAENPAPPNILFIYTDDQADWALGDGGHPLAHTPNMDRLIDEGLRLPNSFVTTPVCSPSRVGLLTSRYGTELDITDWISPNDRGGRINESDLGLPQETPTWVARLRDASYRTGLVGKWHLGKQDRHHPTHFGYDYFYGFREGGARSEDPVLEVDGKNQKVEGLTVDVLTDAAIAWLDAAAGDQPFLLSLHYRAPHGPYLPVSEDDWEHFDGKTPALPKPEHPDIDVELTTQKLREYLACVAGIDRNLGRILEYLEDAGLEENTLVIFTSDHGYNIGHHGIIHKGNASWITNAARDLDKNDKRRPNMFDTSLRVPTILRWPGHIPPGSTRDEVFTNLDWYPTLLAVAGLTPAPDTILRGNNFLPRLHNPRAPWEETVYGEYGMHHYVRADLRMIRTPVWKLVRDFHDPARNALYYLADDPLEENNVYDVPAYAGVQHALKKQLFEKMRSIDDPLLQRLSDAH